MDDSGPRPAATPPDGTAPAGRRVGREGREQEQEGKEQPSSARPVQRIRRRDLAPPAEFGGDLLVWAAWLYYEEGLTQEAVAERLGVSRTSVINFLAEARQGGVVSIAVEPERLGSVRLARELAGRFGLRDALVIPAGGERPLYERIGQAGARHLARALGPQDVLGVSWGRTVLALSHALPALALPHASVVQITGSAISTEEFSPEFCTATIASRIGARCVNLHAPGIVSRAGVKRVLMAEPSLVQHFAVARASTRILFGIAGVDAASVPVRSGYLTPEASRPYLERGAVGVLAGRFLDRAGAPVPGDLDGRMIGLTLKEIRGIPERLCVAGGPDKVEAIRAMLRGGYATQLVTDAATAEGLLAVPD